MRSIRGSGLVCGAVLLLLGAAAVALFLAKPDGPEAAKPGSAHSPAAGERQAAATPPSPTPREDSSSERSDLPATREALPAPFHGVCAVRGRVHRGGRGVERASVHLKWESPEASLGIPPILRTRTGADGSFSFDVVPPGPATLTVLPPATEGGEFATRARTIEVPRAPEILVDIPLSGGTIAGRVVQASDGTPIPHAVVMVFPEGALQGGATDGSIGTAPTDMQGRYRIQGLEPGRYHLHVRAVAGLSRTPPPFLEDAGFLARGERGSLVVAEEEEVTADFSLDSGGTAAVTVLDPAGRALGGALVRVVPAVEVGDPRRSWDARQGWTDAEGVARVPGLAPGTYYAVLEGGPFAARDSVEATVLAGEETPFRIELREGARVNVTVVDEAGLPVRGASAEFTNERGHEERVEFKLPSGGQERVGSAVLLPGRYRLAAEAEGFLPTSTTVEVAAGPRQEVVVRLARPAGR